MEEHVNEYDIAIIGMMGRFPGARTLADFWENLCAGKESISFFNDEELDAWGVPAERRRAPNYVAAEPILEDIDLFDAAFFGYSAREAEILDPQQRLFLECAWEALEDAGYGTTLSSRLVGVYAGMGPASYLVFNLLSATLLDHEDDVMRVMMGNDKGFLSTRIAYHLNLNGPCIDVNCACSTSLVAVSLACDALLSYQCDMALAGGITLNMPHRRGYLYQEGGTTSPDGHCRPFDAAAQGTVFGSGAGVVVLKRLANALADGDHIYAVIKGSSVNNDGANKVGYTAPSVEGQAEVIARALSLAAVDPATIGYVEAHGTATALGDPIEVAALTRAFQSSTDQVGICALGSVKSNIGHLDAAAGVAGLIKATLAVQHGLIPPTLHYEQPNRQIDLAASPFYVNTQCQPWPASDTPRRAGVSSLGIGGTNAHVIVEQALPPSAMPAERRWHLLPLAARSQAALERAAARLATHLAAHPGLPLADVAYTLQVGRHPFAYRRVLVCQDRAEALDALAGTQPWLVRENQGVEGATGVVFLFPGQGSQHVGMGKDLYEHVPRFRSVVDDCCARLRPLLGLDLRTVLYPSESQAAPAAAQLADTRLAQPALFVIEYALAQLWLSWGIEPVALLGHSLGEYVAACLADVFTLDDALMVVAARGRLMSQSAPGAMLAVALPAAEVRALLRLEVELAAINGPRACVVSGPQAMMAELETQLRAQGVECRRLHTAQAFHSPLMEPVLPAFRTVLDRVQLQPPTRAVVSNVTGQWLTAQEATDREYWVRQARAAVQFADGLAKVQAGGRRVLLEVGPGQALSTLARQQVDGGISLVVPAMRHPQQAADDEAQALQALGGLWLAGVALDWERVWEPVRGRRVPLPTYPFERRRYWVEQQRREAETTRTDQLSRARFAEWFYAPTWKRIPLAGGQPALSNRHWLLFVDAHGLGQALATALIAAHEDVTLVEPGDHFAVIDHSIYRLPPCDRDAYRALLAHLAQAERTPTDIVHLWNIGPLEESDPPARLAQAQGLYSLLGLAQALGADAQSCRLTVLSSGVQSVTGSEPLLPERATLLGLCRVLPQEYPQIRCRSIDVEWPLPEPASQVVAALFQDLAASDPTPLVAYRGRHRWLPHFERLQLPAAKDRTRLREQGVYLITGGFGGLGSALARHLAETVQARLVLVGRTALPPRPSWDAWLAGHPVDEAVSRRIQQVRALEALGSDVLVASADISERAQVRAMLDQTLAHFGVIHGVIHAAGSREASFYPIQETDTAACESIFRAKVVGLNELWHALQDQPLDFWLLQSSLSSFLGGLGLAAYAAANSYMDTFAHQRNQAGAGPWISVNWDAWQLADAAGDTQRLGARFAEFLIRPDEGRAAFQHLLESHVSDQVAVSTVDLTQRWIEWQVSIQEHALKSPPVHAQRGDLHPRPTLPTLYVAVTSETEQHVAEIWHELLGTGPLGIHDNFFDLGGDSLMATQLVSRLRQRFDVDLSLRTFFTTPTIAAIAAALATAVQTNTSSNKIVAVARESRRMKRTSLPQD